MKFPEQKPKIEDAEIGLPIDFLLSEFNDIKPRSGISELGNDFLYNVDPQKVLGIGKVEYENLKKTIQKNGGRAKIVVHPYFSKFDNEGKKVFNPEGHQKVFEHFEKTIRARKENATLPPMFIFEDETNVKYTIEQIKKILNIEEEEFPKYGIFILKTFKGHGVPKISKLATKIDDSGLSAKLVVEDEFKYLFNLFGPRNLNVRKVAFMGMYIELNPDRDDSFALCLGTFVNNFLKKYKKRDITLSAFGIGGSITKSQEDGPILTSGIEHYKKMMERIQKRVS